MPKQLNADAQAYDKEYDAFLKQLEDFHQQRGTIFKRLPRINGKGIDLYLLYVVVTARGGWQKVNARNEWDDILEDFRLPAACVNAATALKHIYIRYLDSYERIHFLGEDGDERTNDADEDDSRSMRVKRSARALNTVPLTYNYQQHNVSENLRTSSGMSTEMFKGSIYDRLALSLSSPLPNEHDFGFNMCTLLSNEGKHTLQLPQCSRLIEFMLAHTGVFRDKETQKYFISNYKEAKGKSLVQFWIDSVEDKSVLDLLSPETFDSGGPDENGTVILGVRPPLRNSTVKDAGINKAPNTKEISAPPTPLGDREGGRLVAPAPPKSAGVTVSPPCPEKFADGDVVCTEYSNGEGETDEYADSRNEDQRGQGTLKKTTPDSIIAEEDKKEKEAAISSKLEEVLACEVVDLRLEPEDTEIFHLGRDLGLLDSEGTRISQVLHILRNLSFEEVNIPILAQSNTCLRFLVLCVCSRWGGLAVGALDTLGNIAAEILLKDPAVDPTSALLLTTICQGVSSQDRALVLRSLEVLNRLAMSDPNEEILGRNMDQTVYDQICRFLTIHDIMLLIYTLESLYSLSSMGPSSCNAIVRAKGSIQTLISLLTVEAQSYGPEACIGMKVVETVTGVVSETDSSSSTTTTNVVNSSTVTTSTATTVVAGATPTTSNVSQQSTTSTTTAPIGTPPPKVLPKPSEINKRVVPPEVEEFVTGWVVKNYDACPNNAIEQAIVYRHFAASMHALGRKQGLNPVLLSNCVRKVFGTGVGPSRRPVEDGSEKWHYNGIRRKDGVMVPLLTADKKFNNANTQLTPTPVVSASSLPPLRTIAPSTGGVTVSSIPSQTPAVASPQGMQGSILKAQLSAPLRNSPSPVRVVHSQGVVGGVLIPPASPSSHSGLLPQHSSATPQAPPRSDNSSLIKSLLANKVTTSAVVPQSPLANPQLNTRGLLPPPAPPPPPQPKPKPTPTHLPPQHYQQQLLHYQQPTQTQQQHHHQPFLQPKVETATTFNQTPHVLQSTSTSVSRGLVLPPVSRGYASSAPRVISSSKGGTASATQATQSMTPQKPPGYVQLSRNIRRSEASVDNSSSDNATSKTLSFNGICNELIKGDSSASSVGSTDQKKVTSFEGILQNGIKEDMEESAPTLKEGQSEKKNLLADLLEKTVGGDVLNGVVEKDLRITEKGIQVVTNLPYARVNGPPTHPQNQSQVPTSTTGQLEVVPHGGVKRPATPDALGSVKRLAIEDPRAGPEGRITLYVSQNGAGGEVLSQGHQVILNQGQQGQQVVTAGQVPGGSQTVVTPQGQMIIQRSTTSQGNVIMQQSPSQIISPSPTNQIITQRGTPQQHHAQVIYTTQAGQGQAFTSSSSSPVIAPHTATGQQTQQVISTQGSPVFSSSGGQVIQQVIAHGQGGQKVILHGGQLGQVLGGQVIVPQGGGQNILLQGGSGLPGQVIMQGVSVTSSNQNPMIVQGSNGHGQVLVQGAGSQGQVLLQGGGTQSPLVVGGVTQGQAVMSASGQTMIFTGSHGQQVVMGGGSQGQHFVVGGGSQGQGQMLVQSGTVGNTVFLAPQHQGSQGAQKTLIILPNPKMVVSGNQAQNNQVVQVVQMVSSSSTPVVSSNPVRTVKATIPHHTETTPTTSHTSSNYSPNMVSVQVHSGNSGVAPPPSGPTATPVAPSAAPSSVSTPHIPAPQILASGIARRTGSGSKSSHSSSSGLRYMCEWRGCNLAFSSPGQVYHHACKIHCPPHVTEMTCQWLGCDSMVRKRFSAMTHIHDRHCNEQLLQILAHRRHQIALTGKTDIPVPQTPPPHPGYAPNAAFHAIKRHALEVINQRDAVEKEGPVTKSIRLTAALILRNLVIYSHTGKKLLKSYESELANVAISAMESSRTVGQILYDIHLPDHQAL